MIKLSVVMSLWTLKILCGNNKICLAVKFVLKNMCIKICTRQWNDKWVEMRIHWFVRAPPFPVHRSFSSTLSPKSRSADLTSWSRAAPWVWIALVKWSSTPKAMNSCDSILFLTLMLRITQDAFFKTFTLLG